MSNILKEELGIIEFRSTIHLYAPEITRKIQSVWQPDMILNRRNLLQKDKKRQKRQKDKKIEGQQGRVLNWSQRVLNGQIGFQNSFSQPVS